MTRSSPRSTSEIRINALKKPLDTALTTPYTSHLAGDAMPDKANTLPWFLTNKALEVYSNPASYLVLDFETNNLDKGSALNPDNHIVLACWEIVTGTQVVKKHVFADEYGLHELEEDIRRADFVVAHNAKFELQWLKRCGLELRDILVFDTFLAEWVIAGNRKWDLSLDGTAKRYSLGAKSSLASTAMKMGIDPSVIPSVWLLPYCYRDVELARKVYQQQIEILQRDGLLHLALTRNLTCAVLADIEFNGCELDQERVESEYEKAIDEFETIEAELKGLTGGVNLSSPKQLAAYLYDVLKFPLPKDSKGNVIKTEKGALKTDVATLALLKATTDEQRTFVELYKRRNKLDALLSKNLEFFHRVVKEREGTFYGVLNQGFTQTHRLSSSGRSILFKALKTAKGCQLQNLPRQYKGLFTAYDPDYVVGEADGAQLEFRVAADVGHDPVATKDIIDGVDVHSVTAETLTKAGEPTTRQNAKSSTFAPLYGGGGKTRAQKAYAAFFKKKYHGIAETQQGWTMEVLERGYQINPYGMRFYWPGTKMGASGYIDNTTSIYNYTVQGFATGEIIPIALVFFWHRTRGLPITIWNTIHDSIASRVHKDVVEEYKRLSKQCLTTDVYAFLREVYHYEFEVPLGVGVKVAKNWGDTKVEEVWDVYPDGREVYKKKE
jgi:DNA polymerase-1